MVPSSQHSTASPPTQHRSARRVMGERALSVVAAVPFYTVSGFLNGIGKGLSRIDGGEDDENNDLVRTAKLCTIFPATLLERTAMGAAYGLHQTSNSAIKLSHAGVKGIGNKVFGRKTTQRQYLAKHIRRVISPKSYLIHKQLFDKIEKDQPLSEDDTDVILGLLGRRSIVRELRRKFAMPEDNITGLKHLQEKLEQQGELKDVKSYIRHILTDYTISEERYLEHRTQVLSEATTGEIKEYINTEFVKESLGHILIDQDSGLSTEDNRLIGELFRMENIEEHTAAHDRALAKAEYRIYSPEILQNYIAPSAQRRRAEDEEASRNFRERYDALRGNNRQYI